MRCPVCDYTDSRVLESRSTENGESIRRRRECLQCNHRFTTYERIEFVPIVVIKRDGHRESFDRSKVLKGMVRACEKTDVSPDTLNSLAQDLEAEIQQRSRREVSSSDIGEMVLRSLRPLNEVAYIRFASVYRQFQNIQDFIVSLKQLQGDPGDP